MASGLFDSARKKFLDGDLDWLVQDFRMILIDTADYTVNLATHDFLDDIPSGARVATSGALSGKTSTAGVADCDDVTFSSVTGDSVEAVVVYQHSGTESTSALVSYIDGFSAITPNGGDITGNIDSGANKLFKL